MSLFAAINRADVANYVEALFTVYLILIFVRILLSWIPRLPYNPVLHAVVTFVHDVTDPYLRLFRRVLPPVGMFDLSPLAAWFVLWAIKLLLLSVI